MPNFNQSYFFQPHVEIYNACLGDTATLQSSYNAMMDSIIWDLGDGSFSKEYLVKHVYEGSGDYTPKLIVYYNDTRIDTLEYDLQIFSGPDISLGPDTTACLGFGWNFENFEYPILWNDSIVDDKFYPHDSEEVRISVMDEHRCETYDTAYVEILDLPEFSLGNDENICDGDSLLVKPDIAYENFNYLWSTGDTTNYIFVKTENEYTLEITSIFDCKFEDSQSVYVMDLPIVDLGQDMNLEIGNNLSLRNNPSNNQNHYWQDGSTNTSFFIDSEVYGIGVQKFWLRLTDSNACKNSDSIKVNIYRKKLHIVELYPIPTRQFITAINNNDITKEMHIYDDRGRHVETLILDKWEKEFDLSILSEGIYVFKILESGGLIEEIKIVKN